LLVLKRRRGQAVQVGPDIVITVIGIEGGAVVLGVSAPPHQHISRYRVEPPDGPERHVSDQNAQVAEDSK